MGKLRVKVKGHPRKSYMRKGTRVDRAYVDPHTKLVPDKGKPGRTPKSKQWSPKKIKEGALGGSGYINKSEAERQRILSRIVDRGPASGRKSGYATAVRRLNYLRNISPNREVDRTAGRDIRWLQSKYRR